ncbi:MAG: ATP-binding cassette domain-containing protein, partial [Clostridia bacterium]
TVLNVNEATFKEGRIYAVIGANGCGKSNVADAIRWTLGEQSAKTLRGKSMQDVIFAGTEKRKSMSYCEVSLHFDNSEHTLFPSLPYDTVVITRKLDRSGLSEYFINNTRCRMKDIVTLFHDTGIGKEGYSIIGQGRIAEIMSAKPDDRRNIFEEAAGISKFRAQREEAERRLEKTAINLQTASEVIGEIERQLVPLKRQADNALKFFDLRDQLKSQEVNLYIYNFENNQNIKQKIYDRLAVAERELKVKNEKYNSCVQQYEKCLSDREGVDRLSENYTAELMALKVNAEKASGEVNVLKERIGHLQAEKNRLNDELKSVDSQLATYDLMISSSENKKTCELTSYLSTSKELEDASKKLSLLSTTLKGQESDLETRNLEYVQAIEQLGALKGNLSGFIAEKGINEERSKNIMSLLSDKKAQLDAEITNLSIYEGKLKSAKETLRNLSAEYNEALSNKMDANEAIKGYQQDIISLNSRLGASIGNLD